MSMKSIRLGLLASLAVVTVSGLPVAAQQINGTPGSPGATTTIDGKYLPPRTSKRGAKSAEAA
jgi:arylsulfatase